MLNFIFTLAIACGDSQQTLAYRPKTPKNKKNRLKEGNDDDEIIVDFNTHLLHRPAHMPCESFDFDQGPKSKKIKLKNRYSYSKEKKSLVYADFFKKTSKSAPDKASDLPSQTAMWKVHYQYDDNNRIIKYLMLTDKPHLLQKWEISYTPVKKGLQVKIMAEMESSKDCLDYTSPQVQVRRCSSPYVPLEEISFFIDSNGKAKNGKIWSELKDLPKGTRLEFKYDKQTEFLGKVHYFGRELVMGQSKTVATLPSGEKINMLEVEYDMTDKGSLFSMKGIAPDRNINLITEFVSGTACDTL